MTQIAKAALLNATRADFEDALAIQAKALLRKQNQGLRGSYPAHARAARSAKIVNNLLQAPWFLAAHTIVLFAATPGRGGVDLVSLAIRLRELGKQTCYPRFDFDQQTVTFHDCCDEMLLEHRGLETGEAPSQLPRSRDTIDLIVIPVLAIDPTGHFVGDGSGSYDHALQLVPNAVRVAVAFDFQLIPEAPRRSGDQSVAWIATDVRVIQAQAAAGAATHREGKQSTAWAGKEVRRAVQPDTDPGPDPGGGAGDRINARMGIST